MRATALIPALFSAAALVLAFLCLFAGHKKGFMEDYNILTLNVSRLGEGLVQDKLGNNDGTLGALWDKVPDRIQDAVEDKAGEVAEKLGIEDFYSAHLLTYCWGSYTPSELPNATLPLSSISKNLTACSPSRAMFWFNPTEILENALNKTGLDITLDDLEWPSDIDRGLDTLKTVSVTAFVLYCVAIALIFVSFVAALPAVFAAGRLAACVNVLVSILAFLAIGLASALVTAVIEKGGDVINEHGRDIGVVAQKGKKFLVITWVATGLMFVVMVAWTVEVCAGRRRKAYVGSKHG